MPARQGFMMLIGLAFLGGLAPASIRGDGPANGEAIAIEVTKNHIDFKHGNQHFTRYHIGQGVAKPYFFPLNAAEGLAVTRAWPMEKDPEVTRGDHPHQKSLWFCHGDVVPSGLDFKKHSRGVAGIDFWSEAPGHGKIVCVKVEAPKVEGQRGSVVTHNEWRTAEGQKILDEIRTIHYHNQGADANLLVMDIQLKATDYPITFADTKEGSLGVRVRESIRGDRKGLLTNAEGKTGEGKRPNRDRKGVWGLLSFWCDYSGPVGTKQAGIALFADPKNPVDTCWHVGNYGLMAANPFGREKHAGFPDRAGNNTAVHLNKGESLRMRYGVFVHTGDVKSGKVAEHFQRFVRLGSP